MYVCVCVCVCVCGDDCVKKCVEMIVCGGDWGRVGPEMER